MPTRRQLIQKIELNSDMSTITFSNIPQNYNDLKLIYSARSNTSTATAYASILKMNGDSGNAIFRRFEGFSNSISTYTAATCYLDILPGTTNTASNFNSVQVDIPNYTSNNYKSYKSISALSGNSTNYGSVDVIVGRWSSSSPVTSIVLVPNTGSYAANSTFYLYGITHVPIIRGGEVSIRDGFKYHTFRSTSTLQVVEPGDVDVLIVAGGAGGGVAGGGAGGTRLVKTRLQKNPQNYAITIGSGGAADTSGNNTTIASGGTTYLSATGGGRAAAYENGDPGSSGGSGGGGRYNSAAGSGNAGGYTPPEGYSGAGSNSTQSGGGGGGASASGSAGSSSTGGNGGAGLLAFGTYYGGGGGGGGASTGGAGGIGGGGGGAGGSVINGGRSAGLPNTGGGSGGNWTASSTFTGGSGIVVIRYPYDGN